MTAFTHKPKNLNLHVTPDSPEWNRLWAAARAQPWWVEDDKKNPGKAGHIGYVGHDGAFWYFQSWGTTTGFARIAREVLM